MKNPNSELPEVSAIVLCRNEEDFIHKCLDSLIQNDYPKEKLEVLVVDGMSEDRTRSIVQNYIRKYPYIKLIDNPKKLTPYAFNTGIKNSKGDLIMILSAHATYEKSYIRKCVNASLKYDVDNVVGVWKILPRNNRFIDKAIVQTLSSPFGVGNAKYRTGTSVHAEADYVDTGAYGCYKKDVFKRIGWFNENLTRGQDMEFNLRLKKAGGKTLLLYDAIVQYYARTDFKSFVRHNFRNGLWAILPFKYSKIIPISFRHLVPLFFVTGLIFFSAMSLLSFLPLWPLLSILGIYFIGSVNYAVRASIKKNPGYCFILPFLFASLHISYGLGSLLGAVKVFFSSQFWKNIFSKN